MGPNTSPEILHQKMDPKMSPEAWFQLLDIRRIAVQAQTAIGEGQEININYVPFIQVTADINFNQLRAYVHFPYLATNYVSFFAEGHFAASEKTGKQLVLQMHLPTLPGWTMYIWNSLEYILRCQFACLLWLLA